jgi:hypothetical protein
MNTVKMPRGDWDTVIMVLTMARDHGIVAYIDNIIDDIDNQVAEQEY